MLTHHSVTFPVLTDAVLTDVSGQADGFGFMLDLGPAQRQLRESRLKLLLETPPTSAFS